MDEKTLSELEEAIEKWRSIAAISEGVNDELAAHAWLSIGSLLSEGDREEEALSAYNKALDLKPDYADAYHNRGVAKGSLGRYEEAIADYDAAIHLNPQLADAYNNRGNAKGDLDQHEAAIADFDVAIQLDPQLAAAYNNRGVTKQNLGRHEEARKDFQKCLTLAKEQGNTGLAKSVQEELDNLESPQEKQHD